MMFCGNGPATPGGVYTDKAFGPCAPALGWIPAVRYLLRRARIMALTRSWRPGRLLEIGCASGALLIEFQRRGFDVTGVETYAKARVLAEEMGRAFHAAIPIVPGLDLSAGFDVVISCEVLEHIEDDLGALKDWAAQLRSGGRLLLSVPAHPRLWNVRDELAGHCRRYERDHLVRLIGEAGFEVESVEHYAFPLGELLRWGGVFFYGRTAAPQALPREARAAESGIDRDQDSKFFRYYSRGLLKHLLAAAIGVQSLFKAFPWGDGLIVTARKRAS